ncbi:hypothetical protein ABT369_42910 [Dactylosporangium sp. NPDC000244]|uniref:hypothetical protein n=1 Tax=Dactylosporangium sp. NPDC000244 TaxID=3154365 RepID=UPI00332C91D2
MSLPESQPDRPEGHDQGRPAMTDLERRYARWTALFYPADYRRTRGSELVDTYLSLAAPDRRRPSPADIADLAAGGLRQRLRTAPGLGPGFRLAGLLALTTTSALASGWAIFEALAPTVFRSRYAGPFMSLGVAAWAVWLLTAVVYVVAPGRWFRRLAVLAVLVTAGVVPAAMLTGIPRPPLIVLLPQLVLGIVAVGAATRHRRRVRLTPLAAAALTMPVTVAAELRLNFYGDYYLPAATALPAAGATLLIGATLLALGLAARHDSRGLWALLILLTPIGMLALNPLGAMFDDAGPGRPLIPEWSAVAAAAVLVAAAGPALLTLAIAATGRRSASGRSLPAAGAHCPTCGAPSNSAV